MVAALFSGAGAQSGSDYGKIGVNFALNAATAAKAHDRSKNMMTRGMTYQMIGLRAAGVNPMIAATGGRLGQVTNPNVAQAAPVQSKSSPLAPTALVGSQKTLLGAQTTAAQQAANHQAAQAERVRLETQLMTLNIPKLEKLAELFSTDYGTWLATQQEVNAALPNTAGGAVGKMLLAPSATQRLGERPPMTQVIKNLIRRTLSNKKNRTKRSPGATGSY